VKIVKIHIHIVKSELVILVKKVSSILASIYNICLVVKIVWKIYTIYKVGIKN
jgi:hypothetical protein